MRADATYEIEEFGQQLGVQEKIGSCGELIGDCIKEHLRTIVLVFEVAALSRPHGLQSHPYNIRTIP